MIILQKLNKIADKSNSIFKITVLILMISLVPTVFLNVVARFVFRNSIPWSPEVSRYIFIWITFLGTTIAIREKSHAKVDFLIERIQGKPKKILISLNLIVIIAIAILIFFTGVNQLNVIWPTSANYLRFLSIGWIYISVPLCGLFMLFFTTIDLLVLLFSNKSNKI